MYNMYVYNRTLIHTDTHRHILIKPIQEKSEYSDTHSQTPERYRDRLRETHSLKQPHTVKYKCVYLCLLVSGTLSDLVGV